MDGDGDFGSAGEFGGSEGPGFAGVVGIGAKSGLSAIEAGEEERTDLDSLGFAFEVSALMNEEAEEESHESGGKDQRDEGRDEEESVAGVFR